MYDLSKDMVRVEKEEAKKLSEFIAEGGLTLSLGPVCDPTERTFFSIIELTEFINTEAVFWVDYPSDFYSALDRAKHSVTYMQETTSFEEIQSAFSEIKGGLGNKKSPLIPSESIYGQYIKELGGENNVACVVMDFLQENTSVNVDLDYQDLKSVLKAYTRLLMLKDLKKGLEQEEQLLNQLQNQYIELSSQCQELLNKTKQQTRKRLASFIVRARKFEKEVNAKAVLLIDQTEKGFSDATNTLEAERRSKLEQWDKEMNASKAAYRGTLALKAPVEHWKELAKDYKRSGFIFTLLASITGGLFAWGLYYLLTVGNLPLLEAKGINQASIKGTIIFATFISLGFYLLHMFAKFALSSFHLSRDYTERVQMTRVYLSLLEEDKLKDDKESLQVILQSLFSRADTGLLKGDHSPTLPGKWETFKDMFK